MGINESEEQNPIAMRANNPINLSADGPAWNGILGQIEGDASIGRPNILTFRTMQLGMRAALKNNFNAVRNRPDSTILEQIARHANTSDPEEIKGFTQFLDQNNIAGDVKLKDVDVFMLTRLQGVFESGKSIAMDDVRWNDALEMLRREGFKLPTLQVEEPPRR